ncbi:MMPL family transporter [Mycobacterium syngnathidarum]
MSSSRSRVPRLLRTFAVPILLAWLAAVLLLNLLVPQLEEVGEEHGASISPIGAPSFEAMKRIGSVFEEYDSDTSVMILLEGIEPLGTEAHEYYDHLVRQLAADGKHVKHIQNMWGDPLTADGVQSADGKAAYVQVYLAGNQGERLANESVTAARDIVSAAQPPPGVKAYVTGFSALSHDQSEAGNEGIKLVTAMTIIVILVMLLLVYRRVSTVVLVLVIMFTELATARGVVAFLGDNNVIGMSIFASNLLTMLAIAGGTDYAIFLVGRYQEARLMGEGRESAFYTAYRGTAHVILGSGLTIAGATLCLHFTRLPYFQTAGIPMAIGMFVTVVAALTMAPALLVVCSSFGMFDPVRELRTRGWRRIGTAVVRWPGPVLVATSALCLLGLLALPGYRTNFNEREYLPNDLPANEGFLAAERHFAQARLYPDVLLVETDHDLRNPADMLVIDRVAKALFRTRGVGRVQTITRPLGTPIEHTSIPFQISMQGLPQAMNRDYMNARIADMLTQAEEIQKTIDMMDRMSGLTREMAASMHEMVTKTKAMAEDIAEIRDNIADFDDFFRPLRSYFYWEPHCVDIPACSAVRSVFDTLDGINTTTDDVQSLLPDLERLDTLMPQMVSMMPAMIESMKSMKAMMLTMYQTQKGMQDQYAALQENSTAMGKAFDGAMNDDSFYLPPEVFANPDFQRGLKMFISPDGKAVRFILSHEGDPTSPESLSLTDEIKYVAFDAIKGTPLEGSKVYLAGAAATFNDFKKAAASDLWIALIASGCLIFIIMLLITRAVVAAAVIVGTVLLSLGSSFGLSVLIWQHLLGIDLHWLVLTMSVIILVAVGADYNLLLVSRFKEEMHAGMRTGIIRSMGGTGAVVTSAGLVFAFTMAATLVSELRVFGQIGSAISLGLLFDTLIIRAFMTPAAAALLGRWFWWPLVTRAQPVRARWPEAAPPLASNL